MLDIFRLDLKVYEHKTHEKGFIVYYSLIKTVCEHNNVSKLVYCSRDYSSTVFFVHFLLMYLFSDSQLLGSFCV